MIHVSVFVCPSRHMCFAGAWDDEQTPFDAAVDFCATCMAGIAREAGQRVFACSWCGATLLDGFTIYDVPTFCKTKDGAIGEMLLHYTLDAGHRN